MAVNENTAGLAQEPAKTAARPLGEPVSLTCRDGVVLNGHFWPARGEPAAGIVINPATGVLARYYHYYADFLAREGFDVLTYDYRGIGLSRPETLGGCRYRWRDWGEQDFDAALRHLATSRPGQPLRVVGHSIGGYLPGLSPCAGRIDRMLTVGAQYAYWRDYAAGHRLRLFYKWHVVMPALTALYGYFPGRRLGWLEDLPAGVANEWSFRGARMEMTHPANEREDVLRRFEAVKAPILAVAVSDDDIGTVAAVRRTLAYYRNADRTEVLLRPADYGLSAIGHFSLFHSRHANGFWRDTLRWLRDGENPWAPARDN
ncbi:alpha/beta hydrolase family protein [Neorhizobium petrolearium]|uniref:alpha/beta hydrolase family protein n=1 Tax=Neorhizobium petrolearium TaxID=515361 RepID=UPI003F186A36